MRKYLLSIMVLLVLGSTALVVFSNSGLDVGQSKWLVMRYAMLTFAGVMLFYKDKWLLAYYVWLLFCLFTKDTPMTGQRMYVLFFALLFFWIIRTQLDKRNARIILNGIAILGIFHTILIIIQSTGHWPLYKIMPKYLNAQLWPGVCSDTNTGGSLLALCFPAFLRKRWCWGLIPIAIGLYLSQALGGVMACFVGLVAYSCYRFDSKMLITGILIIIVGFMGFYMVKKEPARLKGNLGYRADLIPLVVEQMVAHPIRGYGLGAFYWLFQFQHKEHYKSKTLDGVVRSTTWRRAHNDYLEIAYNQGFVGLLLGIGLIFSHMIKFVRKKKFETFALIGFVGVIIAMANSTVHFLWHTPAILMAIFYLALMINQTEGTECMK